jgi:hypothetical protein
MIFFGTHRHIGHIVFLFFVIQKETQTMCPMCLCVPKVGINN